MRSPVLLLVFNRPQTTRQVFEAIRAAKPPKLYVAADGPRESRPAESALCEEVRQIATAVDWPCEVRTFFRDHNEGCKIGVSNGISWFFENEEEGILLEDDVLPLPTFFEFCDQLLERYRYDDRIVAISGSNLISNVHTPPDSYYFSRYNSIWGWATWRRAWTHYDVKIASWPSWRDSGGLESMPGSNGPFRNYWRDILDKVHAGHIDTWDYQWSFASWRMKGLAVQPAVNQTHNLGFGSDATHTTNKIPDFVVASRPVPMKFPLKHPSRVERDSLADELIDSRVLGIDHLAHFKSRLKALNAYKAVAALARRLRSGFPRQ